MPQEYARVRELEQLHTLFLEEPVLPEHEDALREIAAHTAIPLATGERLYSRWDFKRLLGSGYIDIIQADPSHAGGISETRRIAAMAEAQDVAVALHCPLGPIALAACLQLDATTPNAFIQEQSLQTSCSSTSIPSSTDIRETQREHSAWGRPATSSVACTMCWCAHLQRRKRVGGLAWRRVKCTRRLRKRSPRRATALRPVL
jgi:hypothetical protein